MTLIKDALNFLNGFRKLTIILLVLLFGAAFLIAGKLTGAEYVTLLQYTVPSYMAGNGIEHVTNVVQEWLSSKK